MTASPPKASTSAAADLVNASGQRCNVSRQGLAIARDKKARAGKRRRHNWRARGGIAGRQSMSNASIAIRAQKLGAP
jgi:hypothetical protein